MDINYFSKRHNLNLQQIRRFEKEVRERMNEFIKFFNQTASDYPMHLEIYYSKNYGLDYSCLEEDGQRY